MPEKIRKSAKNVRKNAKMYADAHYAGIIIPVQKLQERES